MLLATTTVEDFDRFNSVFGTNVMSDAIKIGVIADQTGALSIMGAGQANLATLVVDEMNASGGLLGRRVELLIEDSATDDAQAAIAATKLVQDDHVDVLLGGLLALAAGKTNQEIAETLGISAKTAGHHVQHIFDKTGVRTGPPRRSGRSSATSCSPPRSAAA